MYNNKKPQQWENSAMQTTEDSYFKYITIS